MMRGKVKKISNRNLGYLASSELSSPTTVCPGYPNTPEKQVSDLKSHLMVMIEDFKKDINNSIKEIQENTGNQIEALQEETHTHTHTHTNPLKNKRKSQTGQGDEQNHPGYKNGKRNNKEVTKQDNTGDRKHRKETRSHRASSTNRIQEVEERISGAGDTIENINTTVKENAKCSNLLTKNTQ